MTSKRLVAFIEAVKRHEALYGLTLHRIYYYDAPPFEEVVKKPLNGGELNLGQSWVARANKALQDHLQREPFFALRLGVLHFGGWRVRTEFPENRDNIVISSADLVPDVRQKGVDMRIGLDIASLTLKRIVDVIVLVTGDSDFVPAMKFARREGAQLYLVTMKHRVKPSLLEHADVLLDVDYDQLIEH